MSSPCSGVVVTHDVLSRNINIVECFGLIDRTVDLCTDCARRITAQIECPDRLSNFAILTYDVNRQDTSTIRTRIFEDTVNVNCD